MASYLVTVIDSAAPENHEDTIECCYFWEAEVEVARARQCLYYQGFKYQDNDGGFSASNGYRNVRVFITEVE